MRKILYAPLIAALLSLTWVAQAQAQSEPLGDDFIFFVDGVNTAVPEFDGQIVNDPLDPENKVMKYDYGNWSFQAFRFPPSDVGIDMTGNQAEGDVMHLRFLSDPANTGMPGISLMFEDRVENPGDSPDADNPFRLTWFVPDSLHDGEWHDLTIPLPPSTYDSLEAEKEAGTVDSLERYWVYSGSWTGSFGIGLDQLGPNTADRPDLWREYQWNGVGAVGIFWDNNTGGGPIWIDDVYIGEAGLDLSTASDPVDAVASATFAAGDGVNEISWSEIDGAGGYLVYLSEAPITDVTAADVKLLRRVDVGEGGTSHAFLVPHPALSPVEIHYAVTSLSQFGVENTDVSASAGSVSNETLPNQAFIPALTTEEADALFDALSEGRADRSGFPVMRSFYLNEDNWRLGDAASLPDGPEDFDAEVLMGYSAENELFLYAEVQDDSVEFGPLAGNDGSLTWQWDSFEFGFGNYDVRLVEGGGILTGTPHDSFQREGEPDYQFRMAALIDDDGSLVGNIHVAAAPGTPNPELNKDDIPGSAVVVELLDDGTGKSSATTGWKVLTLIPLNGIQFEGTNDIVLPPPPADEIRLIPMNFAFNDADGSARESQVGWSPTTTGSWWNTPSEWQTTAMAGSAVPTAAEDDAPIPNTFELEQNYPNPFNPSTKIRFSLPATDNVTLEVFDILGQRVATLVNDEQFGAGQHEVSFSAQNLSSGVYLYTLKAGDQFVESRRMLLLK